MSISQSVAIESTKLSGVTASGLIVCGVTLSDWVLILTAISVVLGVYFSFRKHVREERASKREAGGSKDGD